MNTAEQYCITPTVAVNHINATPFMQTDAIQTPVPTQVVRAIAEVIIPSFSDSDTIVPPIVASLSQQKSNRWTTWITSKTPNKDRLTTLGANLSRLRIVYINPNDDARWIIWQALAQGNSQYVIAEQGFYEKSDIALLESAAAQGNCTGIIISCA